MSLSVRLARPSARTIVGCMENADPRRKRTVIGEVTRNFKLAKPRHLCVHTSANLKWNPPRLVVYRTNHKILLWFQNFKLT